MPQTQILSIYEPVSRELKQVEGVLRQVSRSDDFPLLSQLLDYVLALGGKQIRPAVTLLAAKFHSHDHELPVLMASAIELLHIATLVHDDTIDQATVRRGRPTVNSQWGKDTAVLLGDYLFAKSATFVCDTGNVRVIRRFAETIMALSAGELREYVASYDWRQTRDAYWKRIGEKTASLFATAAETGALLSGAPESDVAALKTYAHNLGIAYQVVDDILDFEGSEAVVGKPVASDLTMGVMTLPAILLAERYPEDASIESVFRHRRDPAKLHAAVARIREASIMSEARGIAEGFCQKARLSLGALADGPARRSLAELTSYVMQRTS